MASLGSTGTDLPSLSALLGEFTERESRDGVEGAVSDLRGASQIQVEADMLDYGYVDRCSSPKELYAILLALRGGKYGRYEHLEKCVEDKLIDRMGPQQRKKYLGLTRGPSIEEQSIAASDIDAWLRTQHADSKQFPIDPVAPRQATPQVRSRLPPPRNQRRAAPRSSVAVMQEPQPITSGANGRARAPDSSEGTSAEFGEYHKRWENFDPEAALGIGQSGSSTI